MIGSIRLVGATTCMTNAGATDTEVFRSYVSEVLCPALRRGDIVIMDNLGEHKSAASLALIAAEGAEVLFLPAYSPEFNPIEKMWSKEKAILRSLEARAPDELEAAVATAFEKVTPKNAMGWFASCGYSSI